MAAVDSFLNQIPSYSQIFLSVEDEKKREITEEESKHQQEIHAVLFQKEKQKADHRTQENPSKYLELWIHFFPVGEPFQKRGSPPGTVQILIQIKRWNEKSFHAKGKKEAQQQKSQKKNKNMAEKQLMERSYVLRKQSVPIQTASRQQKKKSHGIPEFNKDLRSVKSGAINQAKKQLEQKKKEQHVKKNLKRKEIFHVSQEESRMMKKNVQQGKKDDEPTLFQCSVPKDF